MFEKEKKNIVSLLEKESPSVAATAKKNWKRYSKIVELMLHHSDIDKDRLILDYGSGHGIVSKLLILLGYKVCSFEPHASEKELQSSRLLEINEMYTTSLDKNQQFDCVMLNDVIEHLSIPKFTMEHINDLTRKDGYLMVSTPNVLRYNLWLRYVFRTTGHPQSIKVFVESDNNHVHHQREYTLKELIFTLNHFGFESIYQNIIDTTPERIDSIDHSPEPRHPLNRIVKVTSWIWPKSFANNNLMVLGRKIRNN